MSPAERADRTRVDLALIAGMITPHARVLDVGCGTGDLLADLRDSKGVDARGVEISQAGVNACVKRGLSVVQGDADTDLVDYPTAGFDYVILSQTLQATRQPAKVLDDMLRIGSRAIVSFPNFGHWRVRTSLLLGGRMPVTGTLDHPWHSTPNIHLCTVRDFEDLVGTLSINIEQAVMVDAKGRARALIPHSRQANFLAEQAIFVLSR